MSCGRRPSSRSSSKTSTAVCYGSAGPPRFLPFNEIVDRFLQEGGADLSHPKPSGGTSRFSRISSTHFQKTSIKAIGPRDP